MKLDPKPILPAPRAFSFFIIGSFLVLLAGGLGYLSSSGETLHPGRILPGVRVDSIRVGGLTPTKALQRLQAMLPQTSTQKIYFLAGDRRFAASWSDLGIGYDFEATIANALAVGRRKFLLTRVRERLTLITNGVVIPVQYICDTKVARTWFTGVAAVVDEEPVNARAVWRNGRIQLIPDRQGQALDIPAMVTTLARRVAEGRVPAEMALVIRPCFPEVRIRDLSTLETVISRYSTPFNPARRNRTQNMRLAVQSIDGELLRPGEVFSYNTCVGPRVERYGYLPAPIFSADEVVQGVGGGICQVATTLYNAALLAGLEIVARSHHSRPVDYAPRGRDATVYFGNTDLKFRNNTPLPLYVHAYISGNRVCCELYGHRSQQKRVSLECTEDVRVEPVEERIEDPQLLKGTEVVEDEGRPGFKTTIVRIIRPASGDGKERREVVSTDFYRPRTRRIRVGTMEQPSPSSTAPLPTSAVANSNRESGPRRGSAPSASRTKAPEREPHEAISNAPAYPRLRVEDLGTSSEGGH